MRTAVAVIVGFAGLVLVLSEAAMRPNPAERLTLYSVFAAAALLAGLVCWWLTRVHRKLRSLRLTILVVSVAAVAVAGVVVAASAAAMFLAPPDVRLVLAALTLGTGLGALVAIGVTGPLTADLRSLAVAARRVADGDLDVRTRIERRDEVGEVAVSLDRMVDQLARLQAERERGEVSRRRLLAAVGHDLRTPLASLRAAVEALQDGVAADSDRYLRSMAADIELLRSMVDDLFVLARLEARDLRLDRIPLDLAEIAEGAVEAVAPDRVLRNLLDKRDPPCPP
jgi:two-component system sensor histidine kinase BaeS